SYMLLFSLYFSLLYFQLYRDHRDLHSFPTRRSSDLINNWNDNVIKGHFLSSVLGGGTAKTEFEFLTGNSGAFYPSGSMPYQQFIDRKSTRLNSSHVSISYAVFCLKKKKKHKYKIITV